MHTKVYLAALELGEATMQALSRKSGVSRSTIYTFIEELLRQGYLVEKHRSKRRVYSALKPEKLLEIEKDRLTDLEELLPELQAIDNTHAQKPKVTFYEGMHGIEEVYKDILQEKKEIHAYEDLEHLKSGLSPRIFEWFPKARVERDIPIRTISRDTEFARDFSKKNIGLLRQSRFVTSDDLKTDINIYGDKVALIDLRGEPPFCVVIENKNLAHTMRSVWTTLWERLEK